MRSWICTFQPVTRTSSTSNRSGFCFCSASRWSITEVISSGEPMNAAPDHVVAAELLPLGSQVVAATGEIGAAVFETARAALHLGEGEQSGLVEVGEASALVVGRGDLAVEAAQFGGQEFVVGSGGASGHGLLTGQEVVRVQQGGAQSVEDVGVQLIGADVAFRA